MATNINEEVSNAYNAAKQALNDDLKQNFYNAAQARMTAFRQINNTVNGNHALYSGMPAAAQIQYDAETYVPGLGTALIRSIEKQEENQKTWDDYMEYITKLNEQANYYRGLADQANSSAKAYGDAVAGFKEIPKSNTDKKSSSGSGSETSPVNPGNFVSNGALGMGNILINGGVGTFSDGQ